MVPANGCGVFRLGVSFCLTMAAFFYSCLIPIPNANADTTHDEVYRNEAMHVFVYRDNLDSNVFWYIPPIKLLERDGRIVYYKRPKADHTEYYFYILPYMSEDIFSLLSTEIPNIQSRTQLRPVLLQRLGVNIPQFNIQTLGPEVTDYQFLNTPQLIQLNLDPARTEDFEFFVENIPGIRMDVLFHYLAERVTAYLTIEMSCKDVYTAMQIGVSGRYEFLGAEIENSIFNYIATHHTNVRTRGDIALQEILSLTLAECFSPLAPAVPPKFNFNASLGSPQTDPNSLLMLQVQVPITIIQPAAANGLQFVFRREKANIEQNFYYHREQVANSSEVTSVPLMLSMAQTSAPAVNATPLPTREAVVLASHTQTRPLNSGITVNSGDQLLITSVFGFFAETPHSDGVTRQYRWQSDWRSPDADLYYRIDRGPWRPVNGRAVISRDTILRGELQFYLDKERIFSRIPEEYRRRSFAGLVAPMFTYSRTYPQFNLVITGRNVRVH